MLLKIATGSGGALGTVKNIEIKWGELAKKLTTHKVGKKGEKFFVGGYFSGAVRDESQLIARTLVTLDIDDAGMSLDEIELLLELGLPCAWCAYTTHSHSDAKPRVRVVFPLSREVTGDEYRVLSREIGSVLGIPLDACSFKPNQLMFTPSCADGADCWSTIVDGNAYPVPDTIAVEVVHVESDDLSAMVAAQPLDITDVEVDAYLAAYAVIGIDYDSWVRVGMALWHQFGGSKDGFERWVNWSAQDAGKYDAKVMRGKWRSFDGSANPVTMASVIKYVRDSGAVVSTGRTWQDKIAACNEKHELELLVKSEIANDKSLGSVDLADLEGAVKKRFGELGVVLRADPLRKLFKPKQKRVFPDIGSNDQPLETMGNLLAVCDNNDVVIRYNVIKKDDEILIKGESWSVDNAKNASITWLRSACHKVEMKTTNIKNFVTLLADANQYNPVVEWIGSRDWDGESRLDAFYATVQEDSAECSALLKKTVMLRWMVGAIAAAFEPNGTMMRGVLVFQGAQYTGKTRWIDALAPKELELVKTGSSLIVHDKDSVKQILSCWISELGELDSTFKKSDISALKAFITKDRDELRRPYAAAESQYARRTVFAASVNDREFLQDDTGNSRYWVVPIIKLQHGHTLDMQQVWAEFYQLYKAGEKHYLSEEEMQMLNGHNETFSVKDPIYEMIASHLDWENFNDHTCKWMQVSDVLRWIGKINPTRIETICGGKAIKKLNRGYMRKSHGKQLVAVPNVRFNILSEDFDDGAIKTITPKGDYPF